MALNGFFRKMTELTENILFYSRQVRHQWHLLFGADSEENTETRRILLRNKKIEKQSWKMKAKQTDFMW